MADGVIRAATPDAIAQAAALVHGGGVVAFPTETVYGLGADATNAAAVAQIFAIKQRPRFDPLIVHLASAAELATVASAVPRSAAALAERFWPGPLTLVLPKQNRIPDIVTAGLPSVAIRLPAHPVARALIAAAGCPIAAPSANPFGYISPTTAGHVAAQLGGAVSLILDGGASRVGIESTIVSCLGSQPTLLRAGGISLEDIAAVVGPLQIGNGAARSLAPGQSARHYAPRTPITIVDALARVSLPDRRGAALLLAWPEADVSGFAHVEVLAARRDPAAAAARLFDAMRRLDAAAYPRLFALAIPEIGLGRAIMDRLLRAAAPQAD